MTKKVDRTGQRFTHCTVIEEYGRTKKGSVTWKCLCDCGKEFVAIGYELAQGKIISCKCAVKFIKHGKARKGKDRSKIYSIWSAIIQRCTNPNDKNYYRYGGRGIVIDPSWFDFTVFYRDMGDPPFPRATLDRTNNDQGYNKSNCRWVTPAEQSRNTRQNVWVTYKNKTMILADWCREIGCSIPHVRYYIKTHNLSVAEALKVLDDKRRISKKTDQRDAPAVQNP